MQESCEKIARKLRETLLAKCRGTPKKLNKIKGFHDFAVTETRVFQECLRWIAIWVRIKSMKIAQPVMVTGGLDKLEKLWYNQAPNINGKTFPS